MRQWICRCKSKFCVLSVRVMCTWAWPIRIYLYCSSARVYCSNVALSHGIRGFSPLTPVRRPPPHRRALPRQHLGRRPSPCSAAAAAAPLPAPCSALSLPRPAPPPPRLLTAAWRSERAEERQPQAHNSSMVVRVSPPAPSTS
jgi:hypothetical protein